MNNKKSLEIAEMKKSNDINLIQIFNFDNNKYILYTGLFYSLGLFIGAYFYKLAQSKSLNNIVAIYNDSFRELIITNFCLYLSLFIVTAFFGFCLIGKPLIYSVPSFIGIGVGCRLSYYFINYNTNGIGYSLIMILPYVVLFMTAIAYTIDTSSRLSTELVFLTKGEGDKSFELSPYLKKYMIYFVIIIFVALLDSCLTKLLFSVVTI